MPTGWSSASAIRTLRGPLAWRAFVAYHYAERDSLLDAFTDSDIHRGGTDAEGYIIGGELGLTNNTWARLRYLSADEIDGPPLGHRCPAARSQRQVLRISHERTDRTAHCCWRWPRAGIRPRRRAVPPAMPVPACSSRSSSWPANARPCSQRTRGSRSRWRSSRRTPRRFATEKESLTRRAGTAESKVSRAESGQQSVSVPPGSHRVAAQRGRGQVQGTGRAAAQASRRSAMNWPARPPRTGRA